MLEPYGNADFATGGEIQISSQPGKGSEVRLTLPSCMGEAAQPELLYRALQVEDDPEALSSVAARLKSIGYQVVRAPTFEDGKAAPGAKGRLDLHLNEWQLGWVLAEHCLEICGHQR